LAGGDTPTIAAPIFGVARSGLIVSWGWYAAHFRPVDLPEPAEADGDQQYQHQ
jgi:hypothetical protein